MEPPTNLKIPNQMITFPSSALRGEISSKGTDSIPGDKSISHRAALFSALAEGESVIENFQVSGVTIPMLHALGKIGIKWLLNENQLFVHGIGLGGFQSPKTIIDCGNSATTMRLLAGTLSAGGVTATLDGSNGLRRRPMNRIIDPLNKMGVRITGTGGYAPIYLKKSFYPLLALRHELAIASAQVKSCILLSALRAGGETVVVEPGLSRDHTERMLRSMGVDLVSEMESQENGTKYVTKIFPPESGSLQPLHLSLPGDFSAAAFLIVAACITPGSDLLIRGLGMNPTRTGLLDALLVMGAKIDILSWSIQSGEPVGDLRVRSGDLSGIVISGDLVVRMIDEFPIFAVAAAYAQGITEVKDAGELRAKESDRISDLCTELKNLGVEVYENPEGFRIVGGNPLVGGKVYSHQDHRLAMSLAVAGMGAGDQVVIEHAEVVNESFPSFISILQKLGASIEIQELQV
jgi:3-phosphoshikimate 1-carboxyvinyltransferase